jgi:hypothetical protein
MIVRSTGEAIASCPDDAVLVTEVALPFASRPNASPRRFAPLADTAESRRGLASAGATGPQDTRHPHPALNINALLQQ